MSVINSAFLLDPIATTTCHLLCVCACMCCLSECVLSCVYGMYVGSNVIYHTATVHACMF